MSHEVKTFLILASIAASATFFIIFATERGNEKWAEQEKLQREHEIRVLELKAKLKEDK